MKAAVVFGKNDIRYTDMEEPQITEGSVKVKVKYCGICGSDIPRVLNGTCHSFPQVLGHEFSGVVIDVASDVKSVAVGDHVAGVPLVPCMRCSDCQRGDFSLCKHYSFIGSRQQGAMAEYVVVPAANVYKVDKSLDLSYVALFEPSTVALHALMINNYDPKPDDYVCVYGAGTIALFTLQWCRILGAKNICVIGRNKSRLEIAKKYGASLILSTLDDDYLNQVNDLTGGHGFDYVYDAAGTPDTIVSSLMVAANKSKVCFIGTPTKSFEITPKSWELINRKELNITGSWMSYSAPWPGIEWMKTAECAQNGNLMFGEDLLFRHYPLCEVQSAFENFEKNPTLVKGRIILDV